MMYPEVLKEIPLQNLREWGRVNGFDIRDQTALFAEWERQNSETPVEDTSETE